MKNQLPYCKTSDAIKGYDNSVIAKSEDNDCVVRAIASAFDIEYDKSHKFVEDTFGRRPRQGTRGFVSTMNRISKERIRIGRKCCKMMGNPMKYSTYYTLNYDVKVKGEVVSRKMTVGTFIKKYPVGTYVLTVRQHAFTIKNGVVIGNLSDSRQKRKIVEYAWKVGS
jgi:hypothetical protein